MRVNPTLVKQLASLAANSATPRLICAGLRLTLLAVLLLAPAAAAAAVAVPTVGEHEPGKAARQLLQLLCVNDDPLTIEADIVTGR